MTPERWQRIETLYHAALALAAGKREEHLARECLGDAELRGEVESLLRRSADGAFLSGQAMDHLADLTGRRLGQYEIVGRLGAGGMGIVYRARDTKLHRDVAVKVLPAAFAADAGRLTRFAREAQVLASLNHPNIAAIYGLEERALVLELVEGPTLADRIAKGAIPLEEVVSIARQIAEALEYAHDKGIIHRDLKPGNIKVTPQGRVKVLDFGLAKAAGRDTASSDPEPSPTMTARSTEAGVILGTAAYMAPEQARGLPVDRRADNWAFGVVLFEMLSGKRPFRGESITDVLAAVVRAEVDWTELPGSVPAHIRRLLRRCLTKDRNNRLQAIGDARVELEEVPPDAEAVDATPVWRGRIPWAWSITLLAALFALAVVHFRRAPVAGPLVRFSITAPDRVQLIHHIPSPDGRMIAFTTQGGDFGDKMVLRRLDSSTFEPIPGTEKALVPFWSPDSRYLGYFDVLQNKISKVDLASASGPGIPETICDSGVGGATWNHDNVIVFGMGPTHALYRVAANGGEPIALTKLDAARMEKSHLWPYFLPDGRHFLYTIVSESRSDSGIFVGSLDSPLRKQLLTDKSRASFVNAGSGRGFVVFARGGKLMVQRFELDRLELSGDSVPIADVAYDPFWADASFGTSEGGLLVLRGVDFHGSLSRLTWFDRTGKVVGTLGDPTWMTAGFWDTTSPALSPDGSRVALARIDPKSGRSGIWLIDPTIGIPTRLTFHPADEASPVWSSDGKRIFFSTDREGAPGLYWKDAEGGGREEQVARSAVLIWPTSCSPDGRFLAYTDPARSGMMLLPLAGERTPVLLESVEPYEG